MKPACVTLPLCPSAPPEWEGSFAFGIVGGSVANPVVAHLVEPLPVTDELLAATSPVAPTEVTFTPPPHVDVIGTPRK